ncbi:MAG: hypothetical protein IKG32_06085 [Clostridia bacterium]|nr:hypothetical protein [Clostridia bacterium]
MTSDCKCFDGLYKSQHEDLVSSQVGEFLDAVQSMVEGKSAEQVDETRYMLDDSLLNEKTVRNAVYDALDHKDAGQDNLVQIGEIPSSISSVTGIDGKLYVYRNHAYENIVNAERAKADGRYNPRAHYHDIGEDAYIDAILSIKDPVLTIGETSKRGNPSMLMILNQNGENGAPLYAGLELYANHDINGSFDRRPHIVLTIAERGWTGSEGRDGYSEIIQKAIESGRVLQFDKEKEGTPSVIAHTVSMGNITAASLNKNVAQFKKEVNSFKEKNSIRYSLDDDYMPLAERYDAGIATEEETEELQADVLNAAKEAMLNTKIADENGSMAQ